MSTGWVNVATIDPTFFGRTSGGKSQKKTGSREKQAERLKALMQSKRSKEDEPSGTVQGGSVQSASGGGTSK
ncbi:hypothetical protein FRC06_004896 [Ceratobasidium sp. 370]|nr:hypothetical protein FRC06_004896 [Ceratobasidium sp. 370]